MATSLNWWSGTAYTPAQIQAASQYQQAKQAFDQQMYALEQGIELQFVTFRSMLENAAQAGVAIMPAFAFTAPVIPDTLAPVYAALVAAEQAWQAANAAATTPAGTAAPAATPTT